MWVATAIVIGTTRVGAQRRLPAEMRVEDLRVAVDLAAHDQIDHPAIDFPS